MKAKAMSFGAGVVGSLILTGSASAAFTNLAIDLVDLAALGQDGLDGQVFQDFVAGGGKVYRVYAEFDGADPMTDGVVAVFGDAIGNPLTTTVNSPGGFVNSGFGDNVAPNGAFLELPNFEALNWDTWVTINQISNAAAQTSPDFAANSSDLAGSHTLTNDAWFVDGGNPNAAPINGRVLLAQLVVEGNPDPATTPDIELIWNIQQIGGLQVTGIVAASEPREGGGDGDGGDIPAPGTLALLGLAGFAGRRRRR